MLPRESNLLEACCRLLWLPFAYLQTQYRQAVTLPDALEARFYLRLKSNQVALRMSFLKSAIRLDHGKQFLKQCAVVGHQAQSTPTGKRVVDGIEKSRCDQLTPVKLRMHVGVGKVNVYLPQ